MATLKGFEGEAGHGVRVFHQSAQGTDTALAGFEEKKSALVAASDSLGSQFGLLKLEKLLHPALERVLQCRFHVRVAQLGAEQANEQEVLGGVNGKLEPFDPPGSGGWAGCLRWACENLAAFQVHEKARRIGGPPSAIDPE